MTRCSGLVAVVAILAACGGPAPRMQHFAEGHQPSEEAAVLEVLDRFMTAISESDLEAQAAMQTPDGMTYQWRPAEGGGMHITARPNSYWTDSSRDDGQVYRERYWSPTDYPYRGAVDRLDGSLDELQAASDEELSDVFLVPANRTMKREDIERYRDQEASIIFLNSWIEPYVLQSIASPLTSIASHGFLDDELRGHPRTSGTYSKVLGRYVREQGRLTLMEALRKMTLMPAQRLEDRVPAMKKKGRMQVGADADLVVFDPNRVIDRATYQEPTLSSEGIVHVLVTGVAVVKDEILLEEVYPGQPVRAPLRADD